MTTDGLDLPAAAAALIDVAVATQTRGPGCPFPCVRRWLPSLSPPAPEL